jgi:WD40 repeat protein
MKRILLVLVAVVVLTGAAVTYVVHARGRGPGGVGTNAVPVASGQPVSLRENGNLLFRNTAPGPDFGRLSSVPSANPGGIRDTTGLSCDRFASSAGTALCLTARPGVLPPVTDLVVLDRDLTVRQRLELPGTPSRARLSPDGKLAYWTLFVSGDSYAQSGFSTRAGVLEVDTGKLVKTIEELPVFLDGERYFASDVNYWGITFAPDGNRFYATLGSKGKTYLVEGDFAKYRGRVLRENAECPSLSPDGKRVAFKKRVSADPAAPWRLFVLDLASGKETALAETRSVDDQALWRDDSTLLYALPRADSDSSSDSDVWSVPADGTGAPALLIPHAGSPAV